jgi:hypothetical protein
LNEDIQDYFKENTKKFIIIDIDGLDQKQVVNEIINRIEKYEK